MEVNSECVARIMQTPVVLSNTQHYVLILGVCAIVTTRSNIILSCGHKLCYSNFNIVFR